MAGATLTRRAFVAAAIGAATVAGLGGCAGPSAVSGEDASDAAQASAASGTSANAELVELGVLTVAALADNLPYFQDANNARSGFVYELMEAVAERMSLSCAWSKAASRESLLARASEDGEAIRGKRVRVDVAACAFDCSSVGVAGEGAEGASGGGADVDGGSAGSSSSGVEAAADASSLFSVAGDFVRIDYLTVTQCLVAKKSSSISGIEDLSGAKVGVLEGSVGAAWAEGLSDASVIEYATLTELFSGLQARNVDAVAADAQAANHYLRVAYGDEHVVCDIDAAAVPYSLLLPRSRQGLASSLEAVLQELRDDGTYQQLCDYWFAAADNSRGKTDARTPEQGAPGHDKGGSV